MVSYDHFLSEEILRRSFSESLNPTEEILLKSAISYAEVSIFISHSSKDKELVQGFINLLLKLGCTIYVDWNDSLLPRITSEQTAMKIREEINGNSYFFLFATENALSSHWVPWELGVADQMKENNRIAIIPITKNREFVGSEYLKLYNRIEYISGVLTVIEKDIFALKTSLAELLNI